jgi:hypothetical protein
LTKKPLKDQEWKEMPIHSDPYKQASMV